MFWRRERTPPGLGFLFYIFFFSFFFGYGHGMWRCPGQGLNQCHRSNLSHYSDNARSLTHCTTRELPSTGWFFFCLFALSRTAPLLLQRMEVPCSSGQCQIFNPRSKGRDRTHNLRVPSQIS